MSNYDKYRSRYVSDSEFDSDESRSERNRRKQKSLQRSVVRVETDKRRGSGIVWDKRGTVITSKHVVEGTKRVATRLSNGKAYKAKVIATSEKRDVAVLRTRAPAEELHPIPRNRHHNRRVGRSVTVAGHADGLDPVSVNNGKIVSFPSDGDWFFHNASTVPGMSGGPVYDSCGRCIGIHRSRIEYTSTRRTIPYNVLEEAEDCAHYGDCPDYVYY